MEEINNKNGLEVAVIGLAGRFPGANNINEFWSNLKNGIESISFFSDSELIENGVDINCLNDPEYVKAKGMVSNAEYFDPYFFGYTPSEAEVMDPQIRVFFECVWEALENAGYDPFSYKKPIGLYAGASDNVHWRQRASLFGNSDVDMLTKTILSNRDCLSTLIAYKLNFKGPSITLQTACSTSLVAIHMACQSLLNGECSIALAGGVSIMLPQITGYKYEDGMTLSPDGHCRTFDEKSRGTVMSNGAGVVVLKTLEDAINDGDHIYAVVKGSAINNDGNRKVGFTAPSVLGQAEVIRDSLMMAEVEEESISYIETHGTGTPVGDPIELEALKFAFNTDMKQYCALGALKTNIGHLDAASGVAGFIKTVLALKNRELPPSLHYENPNPSIDFDNSPFFVNKRLNKWENEKYPLRAGVSSFGIGGTNAHIILEEAPILYEPASKNSWCMIPLSAKTQNALDKLSGNLAYYLEQNPDISLPDLAYTMQIGRTQFKYRRAVVFQNVKGAISELNKTYIAEIAKADQNTVVFMFPGQGYQYINIGLELYQSDPYFRKEMDRCFAVLKPMLHFDIKNILFPMDKFNNINNVSITDTLVAQPLNFILEYSLAKSLIKWGVKPDALIGHSLGEYVAACLAEVFTLEDALDLIVLRGKLMQEQPAGIMLSVMISEEELRPLLTEEISLAAVNSSSVCVVSGSKQAMELFEKQLNEMGLQGIRLPVSHAFHSSAMKSMIPSFLNKLERIKLNKPKIPYISNVTGTWITAKEATAPEYWAEHILGTVRFADGITELLKNDNTVFIEVGAGWTLNTSVRLHEDYTPRTPVVNLIRHVREDVEEQSPRSQIMNLFNSIQEAPSDMAFLLNQLGTLWCVGVKIDWNQFYKNEKRRRIPLPTYPFERKRYWIDMDYNQSYEKLTQTYKKKDINNWFSIPSWERTDLPYSNISVDTGKNILVFTNTLEFSSKLIESMELSNCNLRIVRVGAEFYKETRCSYFINPVKDKDYKSLFIDLDKSKFTPDVILYLWTLTDDTPCKLDKSKVKNAVDMGLYGLIYIVQAIGELNFLEKVSIKVVTNNMHIVTGEESVNPEKSVVIGPIKTIPKEYHNIKCTGIDIDLPQTDKIKERQLINCLFSELTVSTDDPLVAYRGKYRWVQNFKPIQLKECHGIPSRLRENGVYVITGGLGGISLAMSEYLAKTVRAKLVLIGRTEVPPSENWDDYLNSSEKDCKLSDKIIKIKGLQESGAEVLLINADVSDTYQMSRAMSIIHERFGEVNGIIHGAGLPDGGMIQLRNRATTDCVIAPKIYGALEINKFIENNKLDFLILCSSLNSIIAPYGQIGYSSANSFLDAFSQYQSNQAGIYSVSINWDSWKEVGMAVESLKNGNSLVNLETGMLTTEGIEVLKRILDSNLPDYILSQLIVSTYPLELYLKGMPELENKESKLYMEENQHCGEELDRNIKNAISKDEIELILVKIFQRLLGVEEINKYDDFFELGGDSLKATVMVTKIYNELNTKISLKDIFNLRTIQSISDFIVSGEKLAYEEIKKIEDKEYYEASSAQKRMYILQQIEKDSTAYNMSSALFIEGEFDTGKVDRAFGKLIERHETLRTSFETIDGLIVQRVHNIDTIDFSIKKISVNSEIEVKEKVNSFLEPFELGKAPLLRAGVIELSETRHILMFDMHHIISDGVSMDILAREFAALYEGRELPELRIQYKDYSAWQNRMKADDRIRKQEEYWLKVFQGEIPVLNLPEDFTRPRVQSFEGDSIAFDVAPEVAKGLEKLAGDTGATLYMVLLAAYNVLLSKYTGQEDIIVGTPIAGRPHADLENLMGIFVNTLAMRNYPECRKTFRKFVEEVRENALRAYENQNFQFEELVEKLDTRRDISRNPLFDTMFVLQSAGTTSAKETGHRFKPYETADRTAKFDLSLLATVSGDKISFLINYCTKLFKKETVERIAGHFKNLLHEIVKNAEKKLQDMDMMSNMEKESIIYGFNNTKAEYPGDKTIHELIKEQVGRTPENIAVVHGEEKISYRELDSRAEAVSQNIMEKGIDCDEVVGILLNPSVDMFTAILGVLKAGAAYLPIDANYPQQRIEYMLKDSRVKLLVSTEEMSRKIEFDGDIIEIGSIRTPAERKEVVKTITKPNHMAYVIYTSGSTGMPKGVVVEHRALVNLCWWHIDRYGVTERDRATKYAGTGFDASVWEIFPYLLRGAAIHIIPEEIKLDVDKINEYYEKNEISISFLPTQICEQFMQLENKSLRYLLTGGDKLKYYKKQSYELVNNYGPTENTVVATCYTVKNSSTNIPIGKPINNTRVYILNGNKVQPVGVAGELCISGESLARGYMNHEKLTQEKFTENPFVQGERIYRTGDMARWLPDGNIEYLGRMDEQVKIRGFRIELAEIESVLKKQIGVKDAAVAVKEKSGDKSICAYIVSDQKIRASDIKDSLRKELPEYMVPAYILQIEKIPVTRNGKLDKGALPEPEAVSGREYIAPRNKMEETIAGIFEEILGVTAMGIEDNFFEMGGHSLRATRVVNQIEAKTGVRLPMKTIFTAPTVKLLAKEVEGVKEKEYIPIPQTEEKEIYPMSSAQKRLYLINQIDDTGITYNMPVELEMQGTLDFERLKSVLEQLTERHEVLRTSFQIQDGEAVQKVAKEVRIELEYEEWTKEENLLSGFVHPFDLGKAPLMRMKAVKTGGDKTILMFDMHHIISDGMSISILTKELFRLYNREQLKPLRVQYKDYSEWLRTRDLSKQKKYWKGVFAESVPVLDLPLDHSRPQIQSYAGSSINGMLTAKQKKAVDELCRKTGATAYMVLLSTMMIMLGKYSRQEDIVVGSPISGRTHKDTEQMMGMFVNTLAMRGYPKGDKKYLDFLKEVRESALNAYENQEYPFEELVESVEIQRDLSRNPLFDVMFVLQNNEQVNFEMNGLKMASIDSEHNIAKFDLTLNMSETEDGYAMNWEYCTDLFAQRSVERMMKHFSHLVDEITANPEGKISELSMLDEEEKRLVVDTFNDTAVEYPSGKTVVELFEEQAQKAPDNIAVVFEEEKMTYKELNEKANQLAYRLRKLGVKPDDRVAILTQRSFEMIIGILGIIKAGGAYVPMDPGYPEERIRYMLEDCRPKAILLGRVELSVETDIPDIDLFDREVYNGGTENPGHVNTPNDLLYIIYTSGTMGRPKGVMIENAGITNLKGYFKDAFGINAKDNILQFANCCFDASVWEIYMTLLHGATLVIPNQDQIQDISKLVMLLKQKDVSVATLPPVYYAKLGDVQIRVLITAGSEANHEIAQKTGGRYINAYGPTETTICASHWEYNKNSGIPERLPIGKPINNLQIYILDGMELCGIGVPGELCIAGVGLARGYLNLPELTAEMFVKNPFGKGRMYRTGDLARWMTDGNIEFLGRIDDQVKIRGYRVELSEIENVLRKLDKIDDAAVVASEDKSGDKCIYAYIVSKYEVMPDKVREILSGKLPLYMIPTHIMQIDSIPLTKNGKIHKKKLPQIELNAKTKYVAPENGLQEKLCRVVCEVLGLERVGINDDIFELGVNSMKAINIVGRLKKLGVDLSIQSVFNKKTVAKMSQEIIRDSEVEIKELNPEVSLYSKYNELISSNMIDNNIEVNENSLGNVLVTGSTGFLGAHIVDNLINVEKGKIYCVVRSTSVIDGYERIRKVFKYYFGNRYDSLIGERIMVVPGNIEDNDIESRLPGNIQTVIHAASTTKHYGFYTDFYKSNVLGTENILNFASKIGAKFTYVSTISVCGSIPKDSVKNYFDERDFYIGQDLSLSNYIATKFMAEKAVLNAFSAGSDALIIRVGNLTNRYSDGMTMMNYQDNIFANNIKSIIDMGYVTDEILDFQLQFSAVDKTAEGIVKICRNHCNKFSVYHLYNEKKVTFSKLYEAIKEAGIDLKYTEDDIILEQYRNNRINERLFEQLVLMTENSNSKLKVPAVRCEFTDWFLGRIGFEWPEIDEKYLQKTVGEYNNLEFWKK
ncbi:hybrid non-ribosomal peptide synthetase/type I polyketide synthase [Ruminiclostridium papyrosolvens]|uniref:Phenolphthiocerol/phthiocerol polyketide synthase subunit E n=1 Tax=Ruminiclostridium papyrosolvens C7 TaxID=1330534 RepID=U4R2K7_9FIRM|nr:hybrid non-ribosomal peptide synthetase/type I polyketide synthase [Ruminiclostridium papyrosolvens]EPR11937.1 beta-ketoacyl synthase [Ruminiclostridium papyrosolvens C7]